MESVQPMDRTDSPTLIMLQLSCFGFAVIIATLFDRSKTASTFASLLFFGERFLLGQRSCWC